MISDEDGNKLDEIDMSKAADYTLEATVTDADGNKTTITLSYHVKALDESKEIIPDVDTDGDGFPDLNIVDKDHDGIPDKRIDPTAGITPDLNIDADGNGILDKYQKKPAKTGDESNMTLWIVVIAVVFVGVCVLCAIKIKRRKSDK